MSKVTRTGNFSNSEIYRLIGRGKRAMTKEELDLRPKSGVGSRTTIVECPLTFDDKAITYITEKVYEKKMGLPLNRKQGNFNTSWGNLCEHFAFMEMADIDYQLHSYHKKDEERMTHLTIEHWTGVPDFTNNSKGITGDIKCPATRLSYMQHIGWCDAGLDVFKENNPQYYWQLVAHCALTKMPFGEMVFFMPYREQLEDIRAVADGNPEFWAIWNKEDDELPYLRSDMNVGNIYRFVWEIPKEDIEYLEMRVKMASDMLNVLISNNE